MRTLVVGGAGFIGSHIVEQLLKKSHTPIILDNFSTGRRENIPAGVKYYEMDITNKDIRKIFENEKIDNVCHLAAETVVPKSVLEPIKNAEVNILGMLNLLENCKEYNIKRFVFSSTGGALYGDTDILPTPEDHSTNPISPYGVSKLTGERYLYYYNKVWNLPSTILRYSNIYGPRQDLKGEGGVVAIFIKKILEGGKPIINGDGRQTRDFVYVDDIARVNVMVLEQDNDNFQIFNIGKGSEDSINKLFNLIVKKLKIDIKPKYGPSRKSEILRSCLNSKKVKNELGWKTHYSLEEGLNKTINYFLTK